MDKILTIGIASYNRVIELERCLRSIDVSDYAKIQIVVSEDKSPRKREIEEIVETYQKNVNYEVLFNSNSDNLGYDRNLKKLIELSSGKYVLLMSDDDAFMPNQLDKFIKLLEKGNYGMAYTPFCFCAKNEYRRRYSGECIIPKGTEYLSEHIYDSILFSGLTFRREYVETLDAERFLNKNYFQVYLFLYSIYYYGGIYSDYVLINCIGDGENGYGKSDSAEKNELLADRKSVFSNLEFHKGLIYVLQTFDKDNGTVFFSDFAKEYRLRSIVGMASARNSGIATLRKYFKKMKTLKMKLGIIPHVYYWMLIIFGSKLTLKILSFPKKVLLANRGEL